MTVEELAARLGRSVDRTRALLREERDRGSVVRRGRRWYLSDETELRFGKLLRSLPGEEAAA
jgi:hypothetical protein